MNPYSIIEIFTLLFATMGPIKVLITFAERSKGLDRAAGLLQTISNRPFRDAAKKYCLLGRAEDWLEQMHAFARAGARHFVFSLLSDPDAFFEAWQSTLRPGLAQLAD